MGYCWIPPTRSKICQVASPQPVHERVASMSGTGSMTWIEGIMKDWMSEFEMGNTEEDMWTVDEICLWVWTAHSHWETTPSSLFAPMLLPLQNCKRQSVTIKVLIPSQTVLNGHS